MTMHSWKSLLEASRQLELNFEEDEDAAAPPLFGNSDGGRRLSATETVPDD